MQRSSAVDPDSSGGVPSDYSCVLCGAGPAGMGFLFYVFKSGTLAEVARNGLLIIDKRASLGVGNLDDYVNVTGNSVAKSLLACLEHERFDEVFGDIREYNELHRKLAANPAGCAAALWGRRTAHAGCRATHRAPRRTFRRRCTARTRNRCNSTRPGRSLRNRLSRHAQTRGTPNGD